MGQTRERRPRPEHDLVERRRAARCAEASVAAATLTLTRLPCSSRCFRDTARWGHSRCWCTAEREAGVGTDEIVRHAVAQRLQLRGGQCVGGGSPGRVPCLAHDAASARCGRRAVTTPSLCAPAPRGQPRRRCRRRACSARREPARPSRCG